MTRAKHRPPHPLVIAYTAHRRHVIDALLVAALALPVAAVYAAAVDLAPHPRPAASAQPTVEQREPTGHGGLGGPVALPSPAAGLPVWTEADGPVIVDGQPLETPQPSPQSVEAAPEPEPVAPAPVVAAAEQPATGLLALVNADRADAGCGPVTIADDLTSQAQTHSNAQAAADQMFHSAAGPEGYDSFGENVAFGYGTEAAAHAGWMESPGHRANVLNCSFVFIGFASADSASGVSYWTEDFAA